LLRFFDGELRLAKIAGPPYSRKTIREKHFTGGFYYGDARI
jgi:hypothetical protein